MDLKSAARWRRSFRRYKPKIVIGFGNKTPMASPDHYQAMLITEAAIFYSRLTKWDAHFEGLPVHTIPVSMYFQLAFEAVTDLVLVHKSPSIFPIN